MICSALRGGDRVLEEQLVEVPEAEEEQRVPDLGLGLEVLPHHGREVGGDLRHRPGRFYHRAPSSLRAPAGSPRQAVRAALRRRGPPRIPVLQSLADVREGSPRPEPAAPDRVGHGPPRLRRVPGADAPAGRAGPRGAPGGRAAPHPGPHHRGPLPADAGRPRADLHQARPDPLHPARPPAGALGRGAGGPPGRLPAALPGRGPARRSSAGWDARSRSCSRAWTTGRWPAPPSPRCTAR